MRELTSEDRHVIAGKRWWIVRRPDAYAPVAKGELPVRGEEVKVDGEIITVGRAEISGDSEFKYYPHIVVIEA